MTDTAFLDDLFGEEPLHEDLVPYLSDWRRGKAIWHPLVHEPMYHEIQNKMYNRMYLSKTAALKKAIEDKKWGSYIFIHERPYRFDALIEVIYDHKERNPEVVWPLIASVWTDSENINQNYDDWVELWDILPERRIELVMEDDERAAYDFLPDVIEVFRGVGHGDAAEGLSWTTNRDKAEWFARRFPGMEGRTPLMVSGTVSKADVLAHFLGRNEFEIVVFPDRVNDLTVVPLG
jgi:hypothetical protein